MKNLKPSLSLCLVLLFIFSSALILNFSIDAEAMSKAPSPQKFEDTTGWKKIDLRAKEAYRTYLGTGKNQTIDAIIKTKEKPSKAQKDQLKNSGFMARTFIGKIITGSIDMQDLSKMANLDFVEVIEMSVPMSLKNNTQNPLK